MKEEDDPIMWKKVAIVVAGIAAAVYFRKKWRESVGYDRRPIPSNPDVEFANDVRTAYNIALQSGNDAELERMYDIWKKQHYTAEELAKPGASGAREAFKATFGLI
jgi:hypothetical protein